MELGNIFLENIFSFGILIDQREKFGLEKKRPNKNQPARRGLGQSPSRYIKAKVKAENLTLLCRACNYRKAIKEFGTEKEMPRSLAI